MIATAVLGAFIVQLLPTQQIVARLPDENLLLILLGLAILSAIALAVPLPVAFDVVVAGSLWAAGFPTRYVMVLYFSLGIYSMYSAMGVAGAFSRSLALRLAVPLLAIGVLAGLGAGAVETVQQRQVRQAFEAALNDLGRTAQETTPQDFIDEPSIAAVRFALYPDVEIAGDHPVEVTSALYLERSTAGSSEASNWFTHIDGRAPGLSDRQRSHQAMNLLNPFSNLGGGSAGDVHGDGWDDLVITSDQGVMLFANNGGTFAAQPLAGEAFLRGPAAVAVLADIDRDGDLDLVATYLDGTNLLSLNEGGQFSDVQSLPRHQDPDAFVSSIAMSDIDRDGEIDLVAGWWSLGNPVATNQLWRWVGDQFETESLTGPAGQTLTVLFADLDLDGDDDLLVGNEFGSDDVSYRNDGTGELELDNTLIPFSTQSTMSFLLADLDGDLVNDLYVGEIGGPTFDGPAELDPVRATGRCSAGRFNADGDRCIESTDVLDALWEATQRRQSYDRCLDLAGESQEACLVAVSVAWRSFESAEICAPLVNQYPEIGPICVHHDVGYVASVEDEGARTRPDEAAIPSQRGSNLLFDLGDLAAADTATAAGLAQVGWTWDTSAADLNNNSRLDVVVANGSYEARNSESNLLFENIGGEFVARGADSGFRDHAPTTGSLVLDFDNDGDLDIITVPIDGAPQIFRNDRAENGASIELEFDAADVPIGTQILVYGDDAIMRRDIVIGGGYHSFDTPRVHVGLGDQTEPVRLQIILPDSTTVSISGLGVNRMYRIDLLG